MYGPTRQGPEIYLPEEYGTLWEPTPGTIRLDEVMLLVDNKFVPNPYSVHDRRKVVRSVQVSY